MGTCHESNAVMWHDPRKHLPRPASDEVPVSKPPPRWFETGSEATFGLFSEGVPDGPAGGDG